MEEQKLNDLHVHVQVAVSFVSFVYFMLINPEVARKAQSQIDEVMKDNRLPTVADRPNLLYRKWGVQVLSTTSIIISVHDIDVLKSRFQI